MLSSFWKRHSVASRARPDTWGDLAAQIVDYGRWDEGFKQLFTKERSLAITGRPGLGKSTYLLWALAGVFRSEISSWFRTVAFLDRLRFDAWDGTLLRNNFSPNDTLLVIDGPFDIDDAPQRRADKIDRIKVLQQSYGFQVVLTMRSDEYALHAATLNGFDELGENSLPWHKVRFWEILQKRIVAWGGPMLPERDLADLEADLRSVSGDAAIYLEFLANQLAEEKKITTVSSSNLRRYFRSGPAQGTMNLVWQVVHKICALADDPTAVLLLLKLMEKTTVSVSSHFLEQILSASFLTGVSPSREVRRQFRSMTYYLRPGGRRDPVDGKISDTFFYTMDGHWREALALARPATIAQVATSYQSDANRYLALDSTKLLAEIAQTVIDGLKNGILSIPQAVLCSDLVKLDRAASANVTALWIKHRNDSAFRDERTQLDDLIFNSWLADAFASKSIDDQKYYFGNAFTLSKHFDKSVRRDHETKPLQYYISAREVTVLPFVEGAEFTHEYRELVSLYERLIGLNEDDTVARTKLAALYSKTKAFREAQLQLDTALRIAHRRLELAHVFVLVDTSDCLRRWVRDTRAEKYRPEEEYWLLAFDNLNQAWAEFRRLGDAGKPVTPVDGRGGMDRAAKSLRSVSLALLAADTKEKTEIDVSKEQLRGNVSIPPIIVDSDPVGRDSLTEDQDEDDEELSQSSETGDSRESLDSVWLQKIGRLCRAERQFEQSAECLKRAQAIADRNGNLYKRTNWRLRASAELARTYIEWAKHEPAGSLRTDLLGKAMQALSEATPPKKNAIWSGNVSFLRSTQVLMREYFPQERLRFPELTSADTVNARTIKDWYAVAMEEDSACNVQPLVRAYKSWLDIASRMEDRWTDIEPSDVCQMLHWAGNAYGEQRTAERSLFAGRYYSSLCFTLYGGFPQSVSYYPTDVSLQEWVTERKLNAARNGDREEVELRITSLRSATPRSDYQKVLKEALVNELSGKHTSTSSVYAWLAESVLGDEWNARPRDLRILADGLYYERKIDTCLAIWKRVVKSVVFPEKFFAFVLAKAIADTKPKQSPLRDV